MSPSLSLNFFDSKFKLTVIELTDTEVQLYFVPDSDDEITLIQDELKFLPTLLFLKGKESSEVGFKMGLCGSF